jgi:hypothetical protein
VYASPLVAGEDLESVGPVAVVTVPGWGILVRDFIEREGGDVSNVYSAR